jgi:hypothetical protein
MVSLVPLKQASDTTETQKKNEEAETKIEMGLATPPLSQQQELSSSEKDKDNGISAMQSESRVSAKEHGGDAILPPYPHQIPPTQDQGHVPLSDKNTHGHAQPAPAHIHAEKPEAMKLHVAP